MYKIGEFSKLSFITVQALRLYDDLGLLKPAKIDESSGYRFYSAEQLLRANYIVALKQLGLALEDIGRLLNDGIDPQRIRQILQVQQSDLRQRVKEEQDKLDRVDKLLQRFEEQGKLPESQTVIKSVQPQLVASLRAVIPNYSGENIAAMFGELVGFIQNSPANFAGPTLMIYCDADYREESPDIEIAAIIDKKVEASGRVTVYELPAIRQAASITYRGPYTEMGQAYNDVMGWVAGHNYRIDGPCREIYVVGPGERVDPAQYISEIQIPIRTQD